MEIRNNILVKIGDRTQIISKHAANYMVIASEIPILSSDDTANADELYFTIALLSKNKIYGSGWHELVIGF